MPSVPTAPPAGPCRSEALWHLDGGAEAGLRALGIAAKGPLWTSHVLWEQPSAVAALARRSVESGAGVVLTPTYQLSPAAIAQVAADDSYAAVMAKAIRATREGANAARAPDLDRAAPRVVVSLSSFGAFVSGGGEYTGAFSTSEAELAAFHRERLDFLDEDPALGASVDGVVFETIPSKAELRALASVLRDRGERAVPAWVTVFAKDGATLGDGSSLAEAAKVLDDTPAPFIGANCIAPSVGAAVLETFAQHSQKPRWLKPNRGCAYDPASQTWATDDGLPPLSSWVSRWMAVGLDAVGGCCGVTGEALRDLHDAVDRCFPRQATADSGRPRSDLDRVPVVLIESDDAV